MRRNRLRAAMTRRRTPLLRAISVAIATLAVAGLLAFASGSAEAACPTFESVGWSVITHEGRTKMVQRVYGGDWQLAINHLQKVVANLKAANYPNAERYEKRLSVVRCLAKSETGVQVEQASQ